MMELITKKGNETIRRLESQVAQAHYESPEQHYPT